MFVSCTVFVLWGTGLCDGPIPRPEESYRLWCVFECDQVWSKTLYTCCEQVGRRGKDYETKRKKHFSGPSAMNVIHHCSSSLIDKPSLRVWETKGLNRKLFCYLTRKWV
jgi:hypothetical protein